MCGAATCRGFIGKRKAIVSAPKLDTLKKQQTGKVVNTKVERVIQGRITKISTNKVKRPVTKLTTARIQTEMKSGKVMRAVVKNGKVVGATMVSPRKTVKTVKKTIKTIVRKKVTSPEKALGKRKRSDLVNNAKKAGTPSKPAIRRKIAKPVSKSRKPLAKIPAKVSSKERSPVREPLIFDTVSHRPRKRNVR
jgi:hypothetical protein